MIKIKLAAIFVLTLTLIVPKAFAIEAETQLEINRLESHILKLTNQNNMLLKDMRNLERQMQKVTEEFGIVKHTADANQDDLLQLRNVEMTNMHNVHKKLFDSLPPLNWGTEERGCEGFGKHQQIIYAREGNKTLRSVCFDGKLIHLGTELNDVPN